MAGEQRRRNDSSTAPLSIARRMELLESRFTTPSTNNNMPASSSPQEAGNAQELHQTLSPAASRHSFNFDAPASRSFSGSSNLSAASNIDKSRIRSKRRSSTKRSSLDDVHLAADRQMQRVMAASPLIGMTSRDTSSVSVLPSPQFSNLSVSNQTVLTSHVKSAPKGPAKVVAESPPTLVSPAIDAVCVGEAQIPEPEPPGPIVSVFHV